LGNVPTADLLCVYSIATQTPINLAQRIAEFWVDSAGKQYSSKICGGEYVSKIAESLGLLTPENVQSMTLDNTGTIVDLKALQNMGLIIHTAAGSRLLGRNQVVWDPLPVAPDQVEPLQQHLGHGHGDEAEHAQEHGQAHPHGHDEGHGFGMGGLGGFQGGQGEGFHMPEFGGAGMPSQTQNLPSYAEFYEQFSQLRTSYGQIHDEQVSQGQVMDTVRREIHSGFEWIFGAHQAAERHHHYDPPLPPPPRYPFDYRRDDDDAGPSGSRQDMDE
jgi:hypothetical protein